MEICKLRDGTFKVLNKCKNNYDQLEIKAVVPQAYHIPIGADVRHPLRLGDFAHTFV